MAVAEQVETWLSEAGGQTSPVPGEKRGKASGHDGEGGVRVTDSSTFNPEVRLKFGGLVQDSEQCCP